MWSTATLCKLQKAKFFAYGERGTFISIPERKENIAVNPKHGELTLLNCTQRPRIDQWACSPAKKFANKWCLSKNRSWSSFRSWKLVPNESSLVKKCLNPVEQKLFQCHKRYKQLLGTIALCLLFATVMIPGTQLFRQRWIPHPAFLSWSTASTWVAY